jgi:uncharacterized membrane protein YeiH
VQIIDIVELVGVAAFAVSGATTAIRKRMDIFGVFFLAMVTAIGGGVIRDVVMDVGIPVFFRHYEYTLVILATAIFVMLLKGRIVWKNIVVVFDAIGLGVFSVFAGVKALEMDYNFLSLMFVCLISGVGGSLMRDIIACEIPVVLQREIYALAALLGGVVLWLLDPPLGRVWATYIALGMTILTRLVSYWLNLNLFYKHGTEEKPNVPE